ncbi:MAG: dipeptidase [Candidatus Latescibacter sp.]|nr:dipeptidase [Candidatus Latescibacter sp.]
METRREFLQKTAAAGIAGIVASRVAPAFAKERVAKSGITLEEAWKVHKKCLIIDGHNDTPVERVARKENPMNWMQKDMSYHTDIPRMKGNGQQYTAFMIVGNGLVANVWATTERVMDTIDLYPKDIMQVLTSADAVRAGKSGKVGVILSIEGAAKWLEGRIETLHIFYRLGVRLVGITHGEGGKDPNNLQGSPSLYRPCTMEEREADRKNAIGLTPFGFEVLKAENELGIVTDTAHINDKAFYDVMEHSTRPPIMSHTAVFALCQHARCLTDDQIKALAAKGGVMGIAFAPMFIDADPAKATVDRVVDHILYAADLVGIDTVGIGTDYDGLGRTIPVVPEVSQLVNLTRAMMARGLTEEEIKKVWGGNFLRVLQKTIDKPRK